MLPRKLCSPVWEIFNRTNLELTRGQYLDMRFEHQENVSVDEYHLDDHGQISRAGFCLRTNGCLDRLRE